MWLRSQGIDAWLCHLLYVEDKLHHPTSRSAWEQGVAQAERELGIDRLELPFAGHAWLDALDPGTELPPSQRSEHTALTGSPPSGTQR